MSSPELKKKIDWPNHIIAFFSALFGILIAFQLDEWRESSGQKRLAGEAFRLVRNETTLNKNILTENINRNKETLSTLESILPFVGRDMNFKGTYNDADSVNKENTFIKVIIPETTMDKNRLSVFDLHISMDQIETPEIHTSAWESAKATGALNYMSLEKVDLLSLIYNNSKLKEELTDLRHTLKRTDDIKTKDEFIELLTDLQNSHHVIQRELLTFQSYVSILENIE